MARLLIVGCGCRGQALAAALEEHAVRGTTRSPERLPELEAAGIEGVVADPDRLATLVPALAGVTVVCWLMGTAGGSPEVHGDRLQTLMEHLVDTPVRGLVYEAAGSVDPLCWNVGRKSCAPRQRPGTYRWKSSQPIPPPMRSGWRRWRARWGRC